MKALVLSGGGAAGPYHLGVMRKLAEAGESYDLIVGTSVGALIGGYVAQFPKASFAQGVEACWDRFRKTTTKDVYTKSKLWPLSLLWQRSLFDDAPLARMIAENIDPQWLGDSDVTFKCSAVSLNDGSYRVFSSKRDGEVILDAIRASAAFPLAFPPTTIGGHMFLDGGLRTAIPIKAAYDSGATHIDISVAISHGPGHIDAYPSLLDVGIRAVSIMTQEIDRGDLANVPLLDVAGVSSRVFHAKTSPVPSPLDFVPAHAERAFSQGYAEAAAILGGTDGLDD